MYFPTLSILSSESSPNFELSWFAKYHDETMSLLSKDFCGADKGGCIHVPVLLHKDTVRVAGWW